jgi:adenylate cyclase
MTDKPVAKMPLARRMLVGIPLGLAAGLLALAAGQLPLIQRIENTSYDWRVSDAAAPVSPSTPIVIVEINDSTIRALEPVAGRWPWPRIVYTSAIDYIARSGARVIAIDVAFLEQEGRSESTINGQTVSGLQSDLALAESIRAAGNVILLAEVTYEGLASGDETAGLPPTLPGRTYAPGAGFQPRSFARLPFADLLRDARGVGHNYLAKDEGSELARRMLPFVDARGVAIPSLGVAAALAFGEVAANEVALEGSRLRLGTASMPLLSTRVRGPDGAAVPSRQVLLNFRRPVDKDGVESVFPTYSFFDVVLSADQVAVGRPPAVPPSAFDGKLVFVGTRAAGTFDRFSTPFSGGAAGVELHATLAENILSHQFMRRASGTADAALTMSAALVSGMLSVLLPLGWAVAAVLTLEGALAVWLTGQVGSGLWLGAVAPAAGGALALFGGVAWQYLVEGREKRRIRALFGRYVSKDIIGQLLVNPALAGLGGTRREMSVLFSDIRGFTSATERGNPEQVVAQLNEYFEAMVAVLFRHHGTLDKFVGDMVMGLFGAPVDDARHADHAVAAALDMSATLETLNRRWQADRRAPVEIGIGINSGEMIAGNIGSSAIMSYTVIGDAVNLASRLESLNKEYGTRILISDGTRTRLTIPVRTRPIGDVAVKGRAQRVMVYEVLGYVDDNRARNLTDGALDR